MITKVRGHLPDLVADRTRINKLALKEMAWIFELGWRDSGLSVWQYIFRNYKIPYFLTSSETVSFSSAIS
jgi:hypothetical protein